MKNPLKKSLSPILELQDIRGIKLPIGLEFLQLIITGPPGAGKTHYINQIGGWPNEGYIDLTQNRWWKNKSLIYRPREIHLGLPYKGFKEALSVFDKEWLDADQPLTLDLHRIKILPTSDSFFTTDWRSKYIFEFLIPSPEKILKQRQNRHNEGYFPVDDNLSLEMVSRQVADYRAVALYLHHAKVPVYIREGLTSTPMQINLPGEVVSPSWISPRPDKRASLTSWSGINSMLFKKKQFDWLTPSSTPQQINTISRIPHDGKSFEITAGKFKLRFHPEIPLGAKKKYLKLNKNWLLISSESCSLEKITGFARIKTEETIMLGKSNPDLNRLFAIPKTLPDRLLSITNTRGDLVFTPLDTKNLAQVVRVENFDHREKVETTRHRTLLEIKHIFGGPIQLLEQTAAISLIKETNTIIATEIHRPKNSHDLPGGLLEIPDGPTPLIIGDLHGQVDNFLKILSEKCFLECLKEGTVFLIILGDAIHPETLGDQEDMESSVVLMDLLFTLKVTFPEHVFYIRGNHDSFSEEISKNGILQGLVMKEFLANTRGQDYVDEMDLFYNSIAYVVSSDSFIACHAAPPREEITRKKIINLCDHPKLIRDITTKRLSAGGHNRYRGYSKGDVKKFRKGLKLPKSTPLIVGHTPMDPFGSVWQNVGAINNHHILYSAHQDGPAIFVRINDQMQALSYPAEPLSQIISKLS